jgi:hypothetical protein
MSPSGPRQAVHPDVPLRLEEVSRGLFFARQGTGAPASFT